METQTSIYSNLQLRPPEDYNFLRQQGMDYIRQLGSQLWTDYNLHDPGITSLELLCYAITDLAYRTGFNTEDIFAAYLDKTTLKQQAFFQAHEILTMNPLTIGDYRKLLIDQPGIHNAWLAPRHCSCEEECNCEVEIYADEKVNQLVYNENLINENVGIKGLYDVLIELEDDPLYGDINDGRVYQTLIFGSNRATLELRLPDYEDILKNWTLWQDLTNDTLTVSAVVLKKIVDNAGTAITNDSLAKALKNAMFIDVDIKLSNLTTISVTTAVLNIYLPFSQAAALTVADISGAIQSAAGIITTYKKSIAKTHALIGLTRDNLNAHRNLDEAFCNISLVPMEDVSICMDVELRPDADIEKVQAQIIVLIEQYLNPAIPVYSLAQLLQEHTDVTEIFNGPRLQNGFIKNKDLDDTVLKTEVHASDMINLIMDIPEVITITNFLMTSYNKNGEVIYSSKPWVLPVTSGHQPRLYLQRSKFLFFKNGLPFLAASTEELNSTLQMLRSSNEHLKTTGVNNELELPTGEARDFEDYFPVQYSYPITYGIGEYGLPDGVPDVRKAQAKQFKAYLLFFEQLLVNYLAQLQHVSDLFILDDTKIQSYFTKFFTNNDIKDVSTLYNGLTAAGLQALSEPDKSGLTRRNLFIDHLLARFAESFSDYALTQYSTIPADKTQAAQDLLSLKIAFLKDYPEASYNRARAIDYTIAAPCSSTNIPGLQLRLSKLLNIADIRDMVIVEHLLLRPRIAGQMLLPICLDNTCHSCYDNDPYSFRLTFVMPGWLEQNMQIDYRRYAENTIRLETPSHLLPKVCWVDNRACPDTLLCDLTDLLWKAQVPLPANSDEVILHNLCLVAEAAIAAMNDAYRDALLANNNVFPVKTDVEQFFDTRVKAGIMAGVTGITTADGIKTWMANYWLTHTDCFIYSRLQQAWCAWLAENAKLTQKDTYLKNRLTEQLKKDNPGVDVSSCADAIMQQYGEAIRVWVTAQFKTGLQKAAFDTMMGALVPVCAGVVITNVNTVFKTFYDADKIKLLQTHAMLIQVMSELKSIYPPATLHDCEDGNDVNPVRLGATAIG